MNTKANFEKNREKYRLLYDWTQTNQFLAEIYGKSKQAFDYMRKYYNFPNSKRENKKSVKYNWEKVNWLKTNKDIAKEIGLRGPNKDSFISYMRQQCAPDTINLLKANAVFNWLNVDWSKSNVEISKQLGTSPNYVSMSRKKYAPNTMNYRNHDWSRIDWNKTSRQIATELGIENNTQVPVARRKYAPETLRKITLKQTV